MFTGIRIKGFKSIGELDLNLDRVNILIGPNGAGKSNLISFFRMLHHASVGKLNFFINKNGGGSDHLFEGAGVTAYCSGRLHLTSETGLHEYAFRLGHAAGDTLIFAEEQYRLMDQTGQADWKIINSGNKESGLREQNDKVAQTILECLNGCRIYQFHNTSDTARIRNKWDINDYVYLREDAANLGPFLMHLHDDYPQYYRRIVAAIRHGVRFFDDFLFEEEHGKMLLRWRERDSDMIFGPHLASDGTLRIMALITLLLQPPEKMPGMTILDEPELGLHPFTIQLFADLVASASEHTQFLIATQSTNLIDAFGPEDIVVVDRKQRSSSIRRLDAEKLAEWLKEYSLAELWEKNVLGGRP